MTTEARQHELDHAKAVTTALRDVWHHYGINMGRRPVRAIMALQSMGVTTESMVAASVLVSRRKNRIAREAQWSYFYRICENQWATGDDNDWDKNILIQEGVWPL